MLLLNPWSSLALVDYDASHLPVVLYEMKHVPTVAFTLNIVAVKLLTQASRELCLVRQALALRRCAAFELLHPFLHSSHFLFVSLHHSCSFSPFSVAPLLFGCLQLLRHLKFLAPKATLPLLEPFLPFFVNV